MKSRNLQVVEKYFQAIPVAKTPAELAVHFHPEVKYEEMPNKIFPQGKIEDLNALLAAWERGRALLKTQKFEIKSAIEAGDRLAIEVAWSGTLARASGRYPEGHELTTKSAMFIELKDGKIFRQRNYDCYSG